MNSCVKLVAAWSVPLDRYEREQAKMASHWQFLFLRERWSRRATVVGEDLEQVTSNCLPGSGQVSSGWMEGIEDHAGYRYLRIRIVTSLRATGSLPPKRGTLVIWTSFDSRARGLINPLRSDLSFFLPHFLSNTRVSSSRNEILTFRAEIILPFQFYSGFSDAPESRRVVVPLWENFDGRGCWNGQVYVLHRAWTAFTRVRV